LFEAIQLGFGKAFNYHGCLANNFDLYVRSISVLPEGGIVN